MLCNNSAIFAELLIIHGVFRGLELFSSGFFPGLTRLPGKILCGEVKEQRDLTVADTSLPKLLSPLYLSAVLAAPRKKINKSSHFVHLLSDTALHNYM